MAGVPSATLAGWAVPLQQLSALDHTYVTSSCGLRWSCWGRSAGGTPLDIGVGSSIVADCLSQPNSKSGIIYGRTGLCHQAANRILHPGLVTVARCRGYGLSSATFGAYGLGPWPERLRCYLPGIPAAGATPATPTSGGSDMAGKDSYDRAISKIHADSHDEETIRLQELRALVGLKLGQPLDETAFRALAAAQAEFRGRQHALHAALATGAMEPEDYLAKLDGELALWMKSSAAILGTERFNAIFGEAGAHPEGLIDRETFLAQERRHSTY
jgi:hypothetical protein